MLTLLEEALDSWKDARMGFIAELENLPPDQFSKRPVDDLRSGAELGRHILESAKMMVGELTRSDGDFTRQAFPQFIEEYAADVSKLESRDEILKALKQQLEDGSSRFVEVGEIHILQRIRRFDGVPATRLQWMNHGIAHEEYHRGQAAWVARLFGEVPALTKLIRGE